MWAIQLVSTFGKLTLFKAKPEDLPYSKVLLLGLVVLVFIEKNIANLWFVSIIQKLPSERIGTIELSLLGSSLVVGISILLLCGCIYSILTYYNLLNRCIQVVTAMLAVELCLTAVFLLWIGILAMAPIPLPANSGFTWVLLLGFIGMLYWKFMVCMHIFLHSAGITILQAGLFALIYMILQHNIAEMIMSWVIQVGK